jgi:hypothetical protein
MSLTSHLKNPDSPVLAFMRAAFPHTPALTRPANAKLRAATTIRPRGSVPYWLIGMAFDYRLRYALAITPFQRTVAAHGASMLAPCALPSGATLIHGETPVLDPTAVAGFVAALDCDIAAIRPVRRRLARDEEERLCRYCVVLALFETVARNGDVEYLRPLVKHPHAALEELLAMADAAWVDDLCALSGALHDHLEDLRGERLVLNPTFAGSIDVGGADADLIVDGCLLDIKTTINPRVEAQFLYQLLGYVLLDYTNQYGINSVGLYYARQGVTLRWPLEEVLPLLTGESAPDVERYRTGFASLFEGKRRREK